MLSIGIGRLQGGVQGPYLFLVDGLNLNLICGCFSGAQGIDVILIAQEHRDGCSHRHCQEGAHNTGQRGADGDGQQDNGGVQSHGARLQNRLEDIAFDLLNQDN